MDVLPTPGAPKTTTCLRNHKRENDELLNCCKKIKDTNFTLINKIINLPSPNEY